MSSPQDVFSCAAEGGLPEFWTSPDIFCGGSITSWALRTKLAWRMKRRKTVSVTPAMGASTVAGAMETLPICRDSGTRASSGTVIELAGFSQNLRIEQLANGNWQNGN